LATRLAAVALAAALVSAPVALLLGWLLPPTGGWWATGRFAAAMWACLAAAGAVLVVLAGLRPPRRTALPVAAAAAALVLCAVPAGGFWTFAVDHGPAGAACPTCAVLAYVGTGPLGGWTADEAAFSRVLCPERRGTLVAQADAMARDLREGLAGSGMSLFDVVTTGDRVSVAGNRATVETRVAFQFTVGTGGTDFLRSTPRPWTFDLRGGDGGWRVCRVTAPPICGAVLRCG
jgi:hypothetical protein